MPTWEPKAANRPQRDFLTFAGTWADGETATTTVGGTRSVVVTAGSSTSAANMADMVHRALIGLPVKDDETRSAIGTEHGEFDEITWTLETANLRIVAEGPPGVVVTITASESSAGTYVRSQNQAADGENFGDNTKNWKGGVVPTTGQTMTFRDTDVSLLYETNPTAWAIAATGLVVDHRATFTGQLGLPYVNKDRMPYVEYRHRPLIAGGGATLHKGGGNGSGFIFLDLALATAKNATVWGSGPRAHTDVPAVLISNLGTGTGTNANDIMISGEADVGLEVDPAFSPNSTPKVFIQGGAKVDIGMFCKPAELEIVDSDVLITDDVTWIIQDGGAVTMLGNIDTAANSHIKSGRLNFLGNTISGNLNIYDSSNGAGHVDLSENTVEALTTGTDTWQCHGNIKIDDPRGLLHDSAAVVSLRFIGTTSIAGVRIGLHDWTAAL